MGDFVFLDGGHGFFLFFFLPFFVSFLYLGGRGGEWEFVCVCVMGEFELLLLLLLLLLEMSAGIATWEAGEEAARLSIVGSYRHHINFSPGGFHLTAYKPD